MTPLIKQAESMAPEISPLCAIRILNGEKTTPKVPEGEVMVEKIKETAIHVILREMIVVLAIKTGKVITIIEETTRIIINVTTITIIGSTIRATTITFLLSDLTTETNRTIINKTMVDETMTDEITADKTTAATEILTTDETITIEILMNVVTTDSKTIVAIMIHVATTDITRTIGTIAITIATIAIIRETKAKT